MLQINQNINLFKSLVPKRHITRWRDLKIGRRQENKLATEARFFTESSKEIKKGENRNLKIRESINVQHNVIKVIEERQLTWFGN